MNGVKKTTLSIRNDFNTWHSSAMSKAHTVHDLLFKPQTWHESFFWTCDTVPAALKGRPTQTCRTTNITSECKHRNWLSCRGQTKTDTRGGATCQLNHSVGSLSATCRAENGMASKLSPNPSGVKASLVLNQPRLLTVPSVVRSEESCVCVCVCAKSGWESQKKPQ